MIDLKNKKLLKETALYASLRLEKTVPYFYVKIKDEYLLIEISLDHKEQWKEGKYKKSRYITCTVDFGRKRQVHKWMNFSLWKVHSRGSFRRKQYVNSQEMIDSILDYIAKYRRKIGEVYSNEKEERKISH